MEEENQEQSQTETGKDGDKEEVEEGGTHDQDDVSSLEDFLTESKP